MDSVHTMHGTTRKRKRLSYACNYCRSKKTRCDEEQPCSSCRIAGVECITTDKRRDGIPVQHRRRKPQPHQGEGESLVESPTGLHIGTPTPPSLQQGPATPQSRLSAAPVTQDHHRLWSQVWGPEGWKTGRLPMMPRFVGSSMLEVMVEWLDMAFFRLRRPNLCTPRPNMNEKFASAMVNQPPEMAPEIIERSMEAYWDTLHQIFPFVDPRYVELSSTSFSFSTEGSHWASKRALKYLVLTAGMLTMEPSEDRRPRISSYISHCNSLLGYIVLAREVEAVQAILLFSIVLRSCDKISWAWDVLTMGVSMAQSIGINLAQPSDGDSDDNKSFTTWWCLYVFERLLALECARPSAIWDQRLSGTSFSSVHLDSASPRRVFRKCLISMANMLHEVQERSARTWRREEGLPQTIEEAIEDKLGTAGELHVLISDWKGSLPESHRSLRSLSHFQNFDTNKLSRPCSVSHPDLKNGFESAFLSYYYHLGIILINRSTLLVPPNELQAMVNKYASNKIWHQSLLSGPSMAVEASRQIIKIFVAFIDSGATTYLTALTSPLAAICLMVVHISRASGSLLIRSDFELMKVAIKITKEHYFKNGSSRNVDDILEYLMHFSSQNIDSLSPRQDCTVSTPLSNFMMRELAINDSIDSIHCDSTWGSSVLDWPGWDWNDLSHLFQHNE